MTRDALLALAAAENFAGAGLVETKEIPFDFSFRDYCAENLCGKYGVNYTCPPDCGTPAEMRERLLQRRHALVLQTLWAIADYSDSKAVRAAKTAHNAATIRLARTLRAQGLDGILVGVSGCALCDECAIVRGEPCRVPEFCYSCMSAYCIFVRELAERCGLEYDAGPGLLAFFGMYVFDGDIDA